MKRSLTNGCFCCIRKAVRKIEIFKLFGSIMVDNDKANKSIDDTDKKAKGTSKTFGEMIGSAAKVGAGIALAMGTAALAVGGLAVKFSEDLQKSLNGVQSATGVADEQMIGMKDTMLAIYNNNFGKNFADIGAAMTLVSQQTGLTGEALQGVTEDALALKDTFGLKVADSLRGANQLMKQFGMDGDAAYNLIAQGAQWGLDANGDLIDTLNEYSGTFAAQGFSAEEMFNMLSNGAAAGVRDVDLLADAIKEFGIRSKDGSKASADGFKALGLNAAEMTKAFAAGGDTAKAAFEKTTTALLAMKDPVAQNAAGVALFGTQFEDLGIKGVTALFNTQGEINKTVDALGKINEVKYNTFGEAMEGIKRNLQTGLLLPLGDQILPKLNEFANWINTNMPAIKNEVSYAMKVVGDIFKFVGDYVKDVVIPVFKAFYDWIAPYMPAIKQFVVDAFTKIKEMMKTVSDFVTTYVLPIFVSLADWFVANWPKIKDAVMQAYDYLKPHFDKLVATIKEDLMPIIMGLWDTVQKAMPGIKAIFEIVMPILVWAIGLALDAIGILIEVIKGIYDFIKPGLDLVAELFSTVFGGIKKVIEGVQWVLDKFNRTPMQDKSSTVTTNYRDIGSTGPLTKSHNAKGTDFWQGGDTWVGEEGPEIVRLPRGSQIFPNSESMAMAKGSGGGTSSPTIFERGAFEGAVIMDDYGVDRLMDRVMDRLALKGVR